MCIAPGQEANAADSILNAECAFFRLKYMLESQKKSKKRTFNRKII